MQHETRIASFETRQKIARIDSHINTLQNQRRTLIGEATTQQSVLQLCDKLKAPIRRIPQDIIKEIAMFSLPARPTSSPHHFPLVFTHVCSLWRTVSLSTPQLWRTLYLTVKDTKSLPIRTEVVDEWFKRANTVPSTLFIYFQLPTSAIVKAERDLRLFLASLSPTVSCVQHLGIGSSQLETFRVLFHEPLQWDLPNMYQLDIQRAEANQISDANGIGSPSTDALKSINFTPALQALVLDSIATLHDAFPCIIPWTQLTHVCVSKPAIIADLVTVVELCTNSRTLVVTVMDDTRTLLTPPTQPPVHCSLEKLSLEICAHCPHLSFIDILSLFRLPNLVDMDLIYVDDKDSWSNGLSPPTQRLNISDFPHLNRLYLNGTSDQHILPILSAAINIRELTVTTSPLQPLTSLLENITYDVSQGVSTDESPGNILPHLSTFRIDETHNAVLGDGEGKLLRKMLGSRRDEALPTGCQRLDRVIFNIPDASTDLPMNMDLMGLEEWCKNIGLQADIKAQNSGEKGYVTRVLPFDENVWKD